MADEDVIIKIGAEIKEAQRALKQAQGVISSEINKIQASINRIKFDSMGFPKKLTKSNKADLNVLNNMLKQQRLEYSKLTTTSTDAINNQRKVLDKHTKRVQKQQREINKSRKEFAGWAMSIMFAGMAIQRAMTTIWRSSQKTFQDVMHSVEGTVTGFDMLDGQLKFLQFTAGEALEPLARELIPIIALITEWISENPTLFKQIVKWGAIIGTLSMAIGMGKLALDGYAVAANLLFGKDVSKSKFATSLNSLNLQKKLAIGASVYLASSAMNDLKNGDLFDAAGKSVFSGGLLAAAFGNKKLGGALISIGAALTLTQAILDDGGELTRSNLAKWLIETGGLAAIANPAVGAALLSIGIGMHFIKGKWYDVIISDLGLIAAGVATAVMGVIETLLAPMKSFVNGLIETYNFITGSNVEPISYYSGTSSAAERVGELFDQLKFTTAELKGDIRTIDVAQAEEERAQVTIENIEIVVGDQGTAADAVEKLNELLASY